MLADAERQELWIRRCEMADPIDVCLLSTRHNLYVCPEGATSLINQVTFRDVLRAQPELSRRYGELKTRLAAEFPNDIGSYVAGKTDFILDALRVSGLRSDQLASIERNSRRSSVVRGDKAGSISRQPPAEARRAALAHLRV